MNNENIAIVVLSYDGFNELWPPFFDYFFKSWPDCTFPIFLLNNHCEFKDSRVSNLLVGDDKSWSDSLIKGLNKIDTEYILFFYDDTFLTKIHFERLKTSLDFLKKGNLKSLTLRPSYFISNSANIFSIKIIPQNALYRNALFANVMNRKFLLSMLNNGETAWDFEIKGNIRSRNDLYYSVNKPIFEYKHGIIKGNWIYDTFNELQSKGYIFKTLNRKQNSFSYYKSIVMSKAFEFFYKKTNLRILLFIENRRKKIN
jgi:hypothetical protein